MKIPQQPSPTEQETELGIQAALQAGIEVMKVYQTDFQTTRKEDNSEVTLADIKSQEAILQFLSKTNYPILSEEKIDDKERLKHSKVWIVDPLDGTADFVQRTGEFSILIGLVENNIPILGIVYQPTINTMYVAQKNKGTYMIKGKERKKIEVNNLKDITQFHAVISRNHLEKSEQDFLRQLNIQKYTKKGSCGLKIADICEQNAEIYFTFTNKIKQWDTCAAHCLITEAGGIITDTAGNPLKYNTDTINHQKGIVVSNGTLHKEIIEKLKRFRQDE